MSESKGFYLAFLLACTCIYAKTSPFPEDKNLGIIGGQVAPEDSAHFMVHISLHSPTNKEPLQCGGTVLSESYVLTAFHCLFNVHRIEKAELHFGVHNVSNHSEPHRVTRNVTINKSNVFVPSNPSAQGRDLAIIKLDSPLPKNDYIEFVELPPDSECTANYDGETLTAYGWGITRSSSLKTSDVLKFVEQLVYDLQDCKNMHTRKRERIQDYHVCTYGMEGDSCKGDSGGPMMIGKKQVAVISRGRICNSIVPAVNVKLAPHLEWIRSVIGNK